MLDQLFSIPLLFPPSFVHQQSALERDRRSVNISTTVDININFFIATIETTDHGQWAFLT
jgi:hypothetical protein